MAIILLIISAWLDQVWADSVIVEYRFSKNFGNIIHDYSGNGYYAKNLGESIFTDRGAISNDLNNYDGYGRFELPPHAYGESGPSFYPSMSIALWSKKFTSNDFEYFFLSTDCDYIDLFGSKSVIYLETGSDSPFASIDTYSII